MKRFAPILLLATLVLACSGAPSLKSGIKAEIGVWYRHSMYVHCGVYESSFGGRQWYATPPLTDGMGNPPSGFSGVGEFRLTSATEAEFRSESGAVARFSSLAPGGPRPTACL